MCVRVRVRVRVRVCVCVRVCACWLWVQWQKEITDQHAAFLDEVAQLQQRDREIVDNASRIAKLDREVTDVEKKQSMYVRPRVLFYLLARYMCVCVCVHV